MRSTKIPKSEKRTKAMAVAKVLEQIAMESAPSLNIRHDQQWFESRVAALMAAAGVQSPRKVTTWHEIAGKWIIDQEVSPATWTKYNGETEQFAKWLGVRGKKDLRELSHYDLKEFRSALVKRGISAATSRNTLKTVRRVLRYAVILGFLEQNPADLLRLRSVDARGPGVQRDPFSRDDIAAIAAALDRAPDSITAPDEWKIACQFGEYYGMRIGDATSRRGEEIEMIDGVIAIRFRPQKKNGKGKEVVLPLIGALAKLPRKAGWLTPSLASYRQPTKGFSIVLRESGIAIKRGNATGDGRSTSNKSFHSYRHTINSRLVDAGVDMRVRQLICDHEDVTVSAGYTHASLKTMADAIKLTL